MYDDARVQEVHGDVRDQKPAQVHLMVYVRAGGGATWEGLRSAGQGPGSSERAEGGAENVVGEGAGAGADVASAGGRGGGLSSGEPSGFGGEAGEARKEPGSLDGGAPRSAKRRLREKMGLSPSEAGCGVRGDGDAGRAFAAVVGDGLRAEAAGPSDGAKRAVAGGGEGPGFSGGAALCSPNRRLRGKMATSPSWARGVMMRDLKNAGEGGSVGLGGDRVAVGTGLGDAVESGGSSGAHVGGSGRGKSVARAGLQGGGEAAEDERGNDFGTSSLGAARAPVRGKRRPVMEPAGGSRRTSARLAAQRESTAASAEPVATGGVQ